MKQLAKRGLDYIWTFIKWLLVASVVGLIGGAVGSAFHLCIEHVTEFRGENTWIYFLLPLGALLICALYKLSNHRIDTNRVIKSVRGEKDIPWIMAPLIFVSTVITHLLGGSAGREGAALQLGGSIGYNLGHIFRIKREERNIIVMAGMSAVFAALFGTPIAAIFFALEVTSVGIIYYSALVPCIISSLSACAIASYFGIAPVSFEILTETVTLPLLSRAAVLAILCAVVAIIFCLSIEGAEKAMKKLFKNDYLRAFAGGVLVLIATLILGTYDYNGAGMEVIGRAIGGEANSFAFLIKIVITAITIAAGFKGGEIVPSFFIGATFGCVIGHLLGLPAALGAAIGFVAVFCGVTNCPITSFLLALEVFGGKNITVFILVCGISFMFSGYTGLYDSQKIMYSKLHAKFINKKTNS